MVPRISNFNLSSAFSIKHLDIAWQQKSSKGGNFEGHPENKGRFAIQNKQA